MVGDGVNDAPPWSRPTWNCNWAGTDVAVEAGDIVLCEIPPRCAADHSAQPRQLRKMCRTLVGPGYNGSPFRWAAGVLAREGILLSPATARC